MFTNWLGLLILGLAFSLLAWGISGQGVRKPIFALPAFLMLIMGFFVSLWNSGGLFTAMWLLPRDGGLGLLIGAIVLLIRHGRARWFIVPGVMLLLLAGVVFGVVGAVKTVFRQMTYIEGQFLLELGPDDRIEDLEKTLDQYSATYEQAFPGLAADDADLMQYYLIKSDEKELPALMAALDAQKSSVDGVERNFIVELTPPPLFELPAALFGLRDAAGFLTNDPYAAKQWALNPTHADGLHKLLKERSPQRKAVVAILDTGVDSGHEDLEDAFRDSPGSGDKQGHGTHCAGIAGAVANNKKGVASYNWEGEFIEIAAYKALADNGSGTAEMVAQAILTAVNDGVDVISLSLGAWSPTPPRVEAKAIEYALKKGVTVVVAAGNSNENAVEYSPANVEGVIVVAAVDPWLNKASFSNTNTDLKRPIAAPGVNILSLKPGGGYVEMSGTSMATPMVAGLVGVMKAFNPDLSPDEVYRILNETAVPIDAADRVGRLINGEAAIQAVLNTL